jgi:hypothetical protein
VNDPEGYGRFEKSILISATFSSPFVFNKNIKLLWKIKKILSIMMLIEDFIDVCEAFFTYTFSWDFVFYRLNVLANDD